MSWGSCFKRGHACSWLLFSTDCFGPWQMPKNAAGKSVSLRAKPIQLLEYQMVLALLRFVINLGYDAAHRWRQLFTDGFGLNYNTCGNCIGKNRLWTAQKVPHSVAVYRSWSHLFFVPQEKIKITLNDWRGFYQSTADSICQDGHMHVRNPFI